MWRGHDNEFMRVCRENWSTTVVFVFFPQGGIAMVKGEKDDGERKEQERCDVKKQMIRLRRGI